MKNRSKRTLVLGTALPVLAALGVYACSDDTLTEAAQPQGVLNDQTLANRAGVEGSLVAAYRNLDHNTAVGGAWGWTASKWVWGSVTSDDAYKGSEASDQPAVTDIELYAWTTGNVDNYLNDTWRGAYEGVVRSNATLRLLKEVQAKSPGQISAADARSIAGEALFLRAHYHFEAWRMWVNVPYYREDDATFRTPEDIADFRRPNADSATVVTEILKDLDSAIVLLPTSPRGGSKGRVSQWTARAYKGRVHAYANQWPAALTTLRDVQASGPYRLEESFDRVWTGFSQYQNGPETILAFQSSANDGNPDGNNANWGERLNFPHSGSPYGCCGFHQPSQNLVNFYAVDASGLPLAVTSPAGWNANDANFTAGAATPVDPRLDWTVGRDGVPYKDAGLHLASWIRAPAYGGFYSPKKNVHEKASGVESKVGWTPTNLNAVNMHIFRYADMLLLLAEAEVEAGSTERARAIVNEIRARAGRAAQGCGLPAAEAAAKALVMAYPSCAGDSRIAVPIDDPSIKWATYRVAPYPASAFANPEQARTAVRYERRLELGMEGQRFFDLRRWGTFQQVLNDYLAVERTRRPYLTAAQPVTDRYRFYPIPNTQIQLSREGNEERLKQNPGW
jgi:hypothetical protein